VKQDDVADLAAPTQAPEPRWLEGIERDAWLSLIGVIIRLPAALDAQLQRDAGLSHFEYMVMVNLSNADDHVLRMSQLAALCHSSLSRLSHVASAAPGHVDAVRAYVIDALDPEQLGQLSAIGDTILGRLDGDTPRR
jgi:hypothetical protein